MSQINRQHRSFFLKIFSNFYTRQNRLQINEMIQNEYPEIGKYLQKSFTWFDVGDIFCVYKNNDVYIVINKMLTDSSENTVLADEILQITNEPNKLNLIYLNKWNIKMKFVVR